MSAAEIFSVLFFNEMRYTNDYPKHPSSDRFILSKVSLRFIDMVPTCTAQNYVKILGLLIAFVTPSEIYCRITISDTFTKLWPHYSHIKLMYSPQVLTYETSCLPGSCCSWLILSLVCSRTVRQGQTPYFEED